MKGKRMSVNCAFQMFTLKDSSGETQSILVGFYDLNNDCVLCGIDEYWNEWIQYPEVQKKKGYKQLPGVTLTKEMYEEIRSLFIEEAKKLRLP